MSSSVEREVIAREETRELKERVVEINRVAKVVKGGRRFSFTALVVIGDEVDRVGVGYGKAREVPLAITKAVDDAKKNLFTVPKHGTTNPINMAKATVDGLKNLRRPEDVARARGLTVSQVLPIGAKAQAELDAAKAEQTAAARAVEKAKDVAATVVERVEEAVAPEPEPQAKPSPVPEPEPTPAPEPPAAEAPEPEPEAAPAVEEEKKPRRRLGRKKKES